MTRWKANFLLLSFRLAGVWGPLGNQGAFSKGSGRLDIRHHACPFFFLLIFYPSFAFCIPSFFCFLELYFRIPFVSTFTFYLS